MASLKGDVSMSFSVPQLEGGGGRGGGGRGEGGRKSSLACTHTSTTDVRFVGHLESHFELFVEQWAHSRVQTVEVRKSMVFPRVVLRKQKQDLQLTFVQDVLKAIQNS